MYKSTKKIISLVFIFSITSILAVIAFWNPWRSNIAFLSCKGYLCPDHILFGILSPVFLYLSRISFGYLLRKIMKIENRSYKEYLLNTKFCNLLAWFVALLFLFGFEYWYQFIKYYNSGSSIQFVNSLLAIPLILPYIYWFRKNI